MVLIAFTIALAAAVSTAGVMSAKIAMHDAVARYLDAAVIDAVADFTAGVQRYVQRDGANAGWQRDATPSRSPRISACDGSVSPPQCPYSYQIEAQITGSLNGPPVAGAALATARNLQHAVIDEGRISARVTVILYPREGGQPRGSRTRYLTLRVFETAPYAVVSGVREGTTVDGALAFAQGDSAGTAAVAGSDKPAPDPSDPERYRDTTIKVKLTCRTRNAAGNLQAAPGNDGLPWGVSAPAFERECPANPDMDGDRFTPARPWLSGDANATGWTE